MGETSTCHYFLLRVEVCQDAYFFLRYGDVSPSTKGRIMGKILKGLSEWNSNPLGMLEPYVKKDGLLKDQVCADIMQLAEVHGDKQPQVAGQASELHLDPGITKGNCTAVTAS